MKNLLFALCGMFILMLVFASCSQGEKQTTEDEAEAVEVTPVTREEEPSDDVLIIKPSQPSQEEDQQIEEKPIMEPPAEEPPIEESTEISLSFPKILINELRTEYEGSSSKVEFIEFKMFSHGNLGGVKVFIASNTQNPLIYEFLPVNVKKGEYVVLHLRTMGETCISEYGDDLNESSGVGSCADVRDFWVEGNNEYLRKTDAVYITNNNGDILDAVIFAEDTIPAKSIVFFNNACEFLFTNNAWKSVNNTIPGHEDALKSSGIGSAMTRSISRDENACDTDTKADWHVTVTGGYTPGKENNPARN